jgi:hypothetical protein
MLASPAVNQDFQPANNPITIFSVFRALILAISKVHLSGIELMR